MNQNLSLCSKTWTKTIYDTLIKLILSNNTVRIYDFGPQKNTRPNVKTGNLLQLPQSRVSVSFATAARRRLCRWSDKTSFQTRMIEF